MANGRGADFVITFFQPALLEDGEFDRQAGLLDQELATLQKILESR